MTIRVLVDMNLSPGKFLLSALVQHADLLEKGDLIVVDESEARARVLPLRT
jgi:hypothetical protein